MKIRVEYDASPIRHIAAQCPKCEKWFNAREITNDKLNFDYEIRFAQFVCPICGKVFGGDEFRDFANVQIEECDTYEAVYKDCLRRREVWE